MFGFDYMFSDLEDENNDVEEFEDVEWVLLLDDVIKDEEEFFLSDQFYFNVGEYYVDSLDYMSFFVKGIQEKIVFKEKGILDRIVLDLDDMEMLKNFFVNLVFLMEMLLLMFRENCFNWFIFVSELKNMLLLNNIEVLN